MRTFRKLSAVALFVILYALPLLSLLEIVNASDISLTGLLPFAMSAGLEEALLYSLLYGVLGGSFHCLAVKHLPRVPLSVIVVALFVALSTNHALTLTPISSIELFPLTVVIVYLASFFITSLLLKIWTTEPKLTVNQLLKEERDELKQEVKKLRSRLEEKSVSD